jgi:hypothetical protein
VIQQAPLQFIDVVIARDAWNDEPNRGALILEAALMVESIYSVERWVVTAINDDGSRTVRVFGRDLPTPSLEP